jgi:hypothetical protein
MRVHTFAAALTMASVFATTSLAQSTSSSVVPTTGVSSACSSFLTTLNNDTEIQTCTAPLLSATQFYANATSAAKNSTTATTSSSANALTSSLEKLCATNTGCNSGLIRQRLSQFWTACDSEIRAKNADVLAIYDVLYLLNPFHEAVCTRDDSKNYCVLNIASDTASQNSTTKRSLFDEDGQLHKRQAVTSESLNGTSLGSSNIAFLFLKSTSDKSVLCSSCAKNVMASYISFETSIPYAIGLANSNILGNQAGLYKSMQDTCGASFTTAVNTVAGTTAFASVSGSLVSSSVQMAATLIMASIAAITLSL